MENISIIKAREKLLRDSFTPAESILYYLIFLSFILVILLGSPRSFWLLGSLLIIGSLTPVILKTHEQNHPFFIDYLWPKFWLCTFPAWALIVKHFIGLYQNPIRSALVGNIKYETIDPILKWLPTSTAGNHNWYVILGFSSIYMLITSIYIVPKSRSFFERLLPWMCLSVVLLSLFGLLQKGLGFNTPLFTNYKDSYDFFAFFPYDGHWAALAILWCSVCVGMALLTIRNINSRPFIHSTGPWYLAGAFLLGMSALFVKAPIPAIILSLNFSIMLAIFTKEYFCKENVSYRITFVVLNGLVACLGFAHAVVRFFQYSLEANNSFALRKAAWEMFLDNPIFGWGYDSYEKLLPFYCNDKFLGERGEQANSDILQLLSELGVFGFALIIGLLICLVLKYINLRDRTLLSKHLLIGCGCLLLLAIFDSPFMSPAVSVSFFIIFFSALRWAELSGTNIDEVDAVRPSLVSPETERGIPFYNENYDEDLK